MGIATEWEGLVKDGKKTEAELFLEDHKAAFTEEQLQILRVSAGLFLFQLQFKEQAKTHKETVSQSAREKFNALFKQEVT